MAKGDSHLDARVIVVGEPGSELVRATVRLARDGALDAVPCDNVYSAVAALAKAAGRRLLVVGPIRDLAGENGAFFPLAFARAAHCCCLLDRGRPARREDLFVALRAGATMIADVQEVGTVLTEWRTTTATPAAARRGAAHRGSSPAGGAARETSDDWRATEAELRALLE